MYESFCFLSDEAGAMTDQFMMLLVSGQTDMGLNQRATILEVDAAGLSSEKIGASNPSDSLNNPPPPSPLSSTQKNQRYDFLLISFFFFVNISSILSSQVFFLRKKW